MCGGGGRSGKAASLPQRRRRGRRLSPPTPHRDPGPQPQRRPAGQHAEAGVFQGGRGGALAVLVVVYARHRSSVSGQGPRHESGGYGGRRGGGALN